MNVETLNFVCVVTLLSSYCLLCVSYIKTYLYNGSTLQTIDSPLMNTCTYSLPLQ